MANLIRSAKSASDWTQHDLEAFRITVQNATAATFFNNTDLPPPSVPEAILADPSPNNNPEHRRFFRYLEAAMKEEESAVDDFSIALLRLLNYEGDNTMIRQRKKMSFTMGGTRVDATADLTIVDDSYCYLVMQDNKRIGSPEDPEAQLIANSIAAFHLNSMRRRYEDNLPPLERQVIPGITMVGTSPIFYRTAVTRSLVNNLSSLQYPSEETVVLRFVPPVANRHLYSSLGMTTVENRRVVLQCFEAFKALMVRDHRWSDWHKANVWQQGQGL